MPLDAEIDPLAESLGKYRRDPAGFVRIAFPWNEPGPLAGRKGPEPWQRTVLDEIGKGIKGSKSVIREAVASGHGIGKSALVSWIILWALCTCDDARVAVTANTEPQLRTKTWPELLKWYRLLVCRHWFTATATSLHSVDPEHRDTWKADALTWSENNTEAFAGLHNVGKRIVLIFDEASAISDRVWEVAEGALTDANTEIIWCAFGNPTRNTGRFKECFGSLRHRWNHQQVDSRAVSFTNKEQISEWIADYGEDSDFVRVRVKGEFPRAGSTQFIDGERVEQAMQRPTIKDSAAPLIMGVDIARQGEDQTVLRFRQGTDARSIAPLKFRIPDLMQVASRVGEQIDLYKPAAVFVDATGIGAGVFDRLQQLGYSQVVAVNFGAKADRGSIGDAAAAYANKRAEMWGYLKNWCTTGCLPVDRDLEADLVGVEYGYDANNAILLEKKEDMRRRGLASPDDGDALCFQGSTLIATPDGERRIDSLTIGDTVLTPFGTAKVAACWARPVEQIATVGFSNGSVLCGTPRHEIFVFGQGACRLDALSLTMEASTLAGRKSWLSASALCIGERSIGFKALAATIHPASQSSVSAFCIAAFGLSTAAQFRQAWLSITRMATGATMPLPTWNLNPSASICATTSLPAWPIQISASGTRNIWRASGTKRRHGTDRQRAGQRMPNSLSRVGESASGLRSHAGGAEIRSPRSCPTPNIAPVHALKRWAIAGISRLSESARSAASRLLAIDTAPRRAVPERVAIESVPPTPVFNLTLDRDNAYYANGILVFNCLTFAYPVAAKDERQTRKTEELYANLKRRVV